MQSSLKKLKSSSSFEANGFWLSSIGLDLIAVPTNLRQYQVVDLVTSRQIMNSRLLVVFKGDLKYV